MIIEYVTAAGGVLDRLTLDDDTGEVLASETGKGNALVGSFVRQYGPILALRVLRSWSNGYVRTGEVPAAPIST